MMRTLIGPFKPSQILDDGQKKNFFQTYVYVYKDLFLQKSKLKYYTQKANTNNLQTHYYILFK